MDEQLDVTTKRKVRWGIGAAVVLGLFNLAAVVPSPALGGLGLLVSVVYLVGILRRVRWAFLGLALYFGLRTLSLLWGVASTAQDVEAWLGFGFVVLVFGILIGLLVRAGRLVPEQTMNGWKYGSLALAFVTVICAVSVQLYSVPTGSMENTVLIGDRIVFQTVGHGVPTRGQIFAYRPKSVPGQVFIKRVVAVPGDRLRIVDKQLFLNGQKVVEPYVLHGDSTTWAYRDQFPTEEIQIPVKPEVVESFRKATVNGELVLPPDQFFVMGDNRDHALDRRFTGFVSRGDFVGRARLIYESVDRESARVRWDRLFRWL